MNNTLYNEICNLIQSNQLPSTFTSQELKKFGKFLVFADTHIETYPANMSISHPDSEHDYGIGHHVEHKGLKPYFYRVGKVGTALLYQLA